MNERGGSVLRNDFSWSWSRHQTFHACLRRYWLLHYASWGGWEPGAPEEVRELYVQKHLSTRPQWIGILVHDAARWTLQQVRDGRRPLPERVVEQFRRRARRQLQDSVDGRYRYFPKRYVGFVEHYYGEAAPSEVWDEAVEEVARQVGALFENPVFLRLAEVPERIREIERLEQVLVEDVPVWVSLDVLVSDGRGGLVVVDWKTGAAHDVTSIGGQLGIYGLYVLKRYLRSRGDRADLSLVKAMYVNLRSGDREVFEIRREHTEAAQDLVVSSAASMRKRLDDPRENSARSEDFPGLPLDDPECRTCAVRRACRSGSL